MLDGLRGSPQAKASKIGLRTITNGSRDLRRLHIIVGAEDARRNDLSSLDPVYSIDKAYLALNLSGSKTYATKIR
jgi:hypothetical protein